jgi:hypothetical protein
LCCVDILDRVVAASPILQQRARGGTIPCSNIATAVTDFVSSHLLYFRNA